MNRYQLRDYIRRTLIHNPEGHPLKGGQVSPWYIDKYKIFTSAEATYAAAREIINLLPSTDDAEVGVIVAPELGGAILASALRQILMDVHDSHARLWIATEEASGWKLHGNLGGSIRGVVIVEDVITTGATMLNVVKALYSHDITQLIQIVGLVDRGGAWVLRERGYDVATVFTMDEILKEKKDN